MKTLMVNIFGFLQCVNDNYLQWSQNRGYVIAYGQNIQHHGKVWLRKPRNEN